MVQKYLVSETILDIQWLAKSLDLNLIKVLEHVEKTVWRSQYSTNYLLKFPKWIITKIDFIVTIND